jgi:signal peptidase
MSERGVIRAARLALAVALTMVVVSVVGALVLSRALPLTGRQALAIDGRSMEPTIPLGSVVVIEPFGPSSPAVGDVVTIRTGAAQPVFTHRIARLVQEDGRAFVATKGDGNAAEDPVLTPTSQVVGRVAWSVPLLGFLLAYLSLPSGTIFFIGLGATLIVGLFLLDEWEAEIAEEEAFGSALARGGLEAA